MQGELSQPLEIAKKKKKKKRKKKKEKAQLAASCKEKYVFPNGKEGNDRGSTPNRITSYVGGGQPKVPSVRKFLYLRKKRRGLLEKRREEVSRNVGRGVRRGTVRRPGGGRDVF